MMKKNILAVALLSGALVIGTGVALAHGMHRATEVRAASQTIGYFDSDGWGVVSAYYWKGGNDNSWPGTAMTKVGETGVFTTSVDTTTYENIIFNNNDGGYQTDTIPLAGVAANSVYDKGNHAWAVSESWAICGSVNGAAWADDFETKVTAPITGTSAVFTLDLKAGDKFKFREPGTWEGDQLGGDLIKGQNGTYFTSDGDNNAVVKEGKDGQYVITITWRIMNYDDKSYGISVDYTPAVPASTNYKMVGKGSRWDGDFVYANGLAMAVEDASQVKIENVTLAAGDSFKFYDETKWIGFSDIKTASALAGAFETDDKGNNNIIVKEGYGATYTFYVDTTATAGTHNAIWITSADYTKICSWAEGFAGESEDLCNGTGKEWSVYATSYGALTAGAKAFFSASKVEADSDPLAHALARAAYRYEYGVAVKGQAAFAATERPTAGFQAKYATALRFFNAEKKSYVPAIVIATVSLGVIAAAAGFVFLRKKRNNA